MNKIVIVSILVSGLLLATGCNKEGKTSEDNKTQAETKVETKVEKETTIMEEGTSKEEDRKSSEENKEVSKAESPSSKEEASNVGEVKENPDGSKTVVTKFKGFKGDVNIEVTASEDKIISLKLLDSKEEENIIKAGEKYADKVVKNNSLVDKDQVGVSFIDTKIQAAIEEAIKAMGFDVEKFKK